MALSGVHVACGYAGGFGFGSRAYAIFSKPTWSETITVPGTTAKPAPALHDLYGAPIFRVRTSVDVYVAIGAAPDASLSVSTSTSSTRVHVAAGETTDFYAEPGDKLAWVAA